MDLIKELSDPKYTAAFQKWCGVVSLGRVVVDNNNLQDGVSKFDAVRPNGVKNGYHPANGLKTRSLKQSGENGNQLSNGHQKGVEDKLCKHKQVKSRDEVHYAILNKPLYLIFRVGALMGNEEFFLGFFPFFLWNVDSVVGRQAIILWALSMYLGQAAKDVIRWPRPPSTLVIRLETEHSGEHGMPSTHAMAGTVIPFSLFLLIHERYELQISPYLGLSAAVTWALVVCLSRLYLGVHSVADVLCGAGSSLLLMASVLPYLGKFDWYIQTHISSPFVIVVVSVAMCTVLYPTSKGFSSRVNATEIMSSVAGLLCGCWILQNTGITKIVQTPGLHPVIYPTLDWVAYSLLRFAIGVAAIVVAQVVTGKIAAWAVSYMVGLEKTDKKHPSVIITYKFITYFMVGLTVMAVVPNILRWLGICRSTFFGEVL